MLNTANTANNIETSVTSLIDNWNSGLSEVKNAYTQTEGLTFRELEALDKTIQTIRGELTNILTKLSDIDKDIGK